MTDHLYPSIVRILHLTNEIPLGVGFLVSERHIVTCSHVVAAALGIPRDTAAMPVQRVHLDFPLAGAGAQLSAAILHWDHQADITILELDQTYPELVKPIEIATKEDLTEHDCWAYGVPQGDEDGHWMKGIILSRTGTAHYYQFESRSGYRPELGFSGGPIWDERLRAVVGMVVAVDEGRPEAASGRMIHARLLTQTLASLGIAIPVRIRRPSAFRYSCFISYPGLPGQQGQCLREFAEQIYDALSYELGGAADLPIYFDRYHMQETPELAQALCESVCMILVLSPKSFKSDAPLCAREFKTMESLERMRLEAICAEDDLSLIIPVHPYDRDITPVDTVGGRPLFGFEGRRLGNLRSQPKYLDQIRKIARHIYICCQALEERSDEFCSDCADQTLHSLQDPEVQLLFRNLNPRPYLALPTRR